MAKFLTIGYGDEDGYNRVSRTARAAAHAHDAKLRAAGAIISVAGNPVQVRNHNGAELVRERGPFLRSSLPVAGFALIEANNLDEAVQMVSRTPCAVAYGVVEVWPLE